ncbi:hypothetical protein GmHk_06G017331 [Glycine max]|nr:hypothetical protein GmHk_06G017331 [Glycine max]
MSIHIFSNSDPRAHLHCAFNLYEATLEKLISEVSIKGLDCCGLWTMATPPASPPHPPPPPLADASKSPSTLKQTRKATRLRSLATRPPGAERPVVHIDPATSKADGPHKKKLRTYLGIVTRDKVDVTYENWKEVPAAQMDLIWTKKKVLQTDVRKKAQAIQKQNTSPPPHVLSCGGYEYLEQKLMAEKTKKRLEEDPQSGSTEGVIDPPSPIKRHVK